MSTKPAKFPLEQIMAITGAAVCLVITILIWRWVSLQQATWPLPGLYFIEIPAVCAAAAGLFLGGGRLGRAAVWASAGILGTFSLLAAFTVGIFYFPVVLILIVTAVLAEVGARKNNILAHLGIFLAAGIIQGVVMLAVVRWLLQ